MDSASQLFCLVSLGFAVAFSLRCLQIAFRRTAWEPRPALLIGASLEMKNVGIPFAPNRWKGTFAVDLGGGEPCECSERFGWLDAAAMPVGTVATAYVCPRDPSRVLLPTWESELRWKAASALVAVGLAVLMGAVAPV